MKMKIFEFIKQKVLHLLNLEPAEFEIYDAKSFGDKKKYIKNYECTNKWKEKWQSVKRNIGYFKEFDQTQWEKLLNLNNETRIRFITNGIPVFFSNTNIWNMRSSKQQRIIIFKRYMAFYITNCHGNLDNPEMAIFFWMLGHEMAHKQVDVGPRLIVGTWDQVREVYCDIRGTINAGLTRKDVDCIETALKERFKLLPEKYFIKKRGYLSWEQRIKYIRKGKFDEFVIHEIVGYGESAEKLIEYYKPHFISDAFAEAETVRSYYDAQKNKLAVKEKSYHMYVDDNSYERINLVP